MAGQALRREAGGAPEVAVFIAEVPELPGCMAHGDSSERALAECHLAIELWVDTAREMGP